MGKKSVALCICLLISQALNYSANAECGIAFADLADVKSAVLNVRNKPDGEILGTMTRGSRVAIVKPSTEWAEVIYVGDGSASAAKGWVTVRNLRFVKGGPGPATPTYALPKGGEISISTDVMDMECEKSPFGSLRASGPNYNCTVEIDFTLRSYSLEPPKFGTFPPIVEICCSAMVSISDSKKVSATHTEYSNHTVNQLNTSDIAKIEFYFPPNSSIKTKLDHASCGIRKVFQFN